MHYRAQLEAAAKSLAHVVSEAGRKKRIAKKASAVVALALARGAQSAVRRLVTKDRVNLATLGTVKAAGLVQRLARRASVRRRERSAQMVALVGNCVRIKASLHRKVAESREWKARARDREIVEKAEVRALSWSAQCSGLMPRGGARASHGSSMGGGGGGGGWRTPSTGCGTC